jgi:hypothetical protein
LETERIIFDYANRQNVSVDAFKKCAFETRVAIEKLTQLFPIDPFSSDVDLVLYGSVARKEATEGSDLDWSLLIDGQADPGHLTLAGELREKFRKGGFPDPGTTDMFGQTTFSHELIHHIGGQKDSNHNLTKRILLLLESEKVVFRQGESSGGSAYDRILSGIIREYIMHDSGLNSNRDAIPRFLLNDIVRYWRTMCVDFAYKQREQSGKRWALRNIKLRMSRKMLYVKGMLMCFSHYGTNQDKAEVCASLLEQVKLTPIDLLIRLQKHFEVPDDVLTRIITQYDLFLNKLSDSVVRDELNKLRMEEVYDNAVFINLRDGCDELQKDLDHLFLHNKGPLQTLTFKYGLF